MRTFFVTLISIFAIASVVSCTKTKTIVKKDRSTVKAINNLQEALEKQNTEVEAAQVEKTEAKETIRLALLDLDRAAIALKNIGVVFVTTQTHEGFVEHDYEVNLNMENFNESKDLAVLARQKATCEFFAEKALAFLQLELPLDLDINDVKKIRRMEIVIVDLIQQLQIKIETAEGLVEKQKAFIAQLEKHGCSIVAVNEIGHLSQVEGDCGLPQDFSSANDVFGLLGQLQALSPQDDTELGWLVELKNKVFRQLQGFASLNSISEKHWASVTIDEDNVGLIEIHYDSDKLILNKDTKSALVSDLVNIESAASVKGSALAPYRSSAIRLKQSVNKSSRYFLTDAHKEFCKNKGKLIKYKFDDYLLSGQALHFFATFEQAFKDAAFTQTLLDHPHITLTQNKANYRYGRDGRAFCGFIKHTPTSRSYTLKVSSWISLEDLKKCLEIDSE
jgi:hypothetical protein